MSEIGYWSRRPWERRISRRGALRVGALGAAGMAGAALVGCGADDDGDDTANGTPGTPSPGETPDPGAGRRGGNLTMATTQQPGNFDPHFSSSGWDERWLWLVFDNLIQLNADGEVSLDESLAESFELPDDNTMLFGLRQGAQFHDGSEINAEVVKWNIERSLDPDRSAVAKPMFANIESVDVVDEHTVRFNLAQPDASLTYALGGKGGMIMSREHYESVGDEDDLARDPVGSGPFRFVRWRDESDLTLERNEQWWWHDEEGVQGPYLDGMTIRVIPEDIVIATSLQGAEIDHIDEPNVVFQELLDDPDIRIVTNEGAAMTNVYWNHGMAPLDDVRVRRAIASAWNLEDKNNLFFYGTADVADAMIPSGSPAYRSMPNHPTFDMQAARDYLEASGLGEGDREFRITGTGAVWGGLDAVTLFVENMAELGFRVTHTPETEGRTFRAFDGDATYASASGVSLRDPFGNIAQLYTERGTYNMGFADTGDEIPELLNQARATYDVEEQMGHFHRILEIASDELYSSLPGLYYGRWSYSRQHVHGATYGWEGKPRLWRLWIES